MTDTVLAGSQAFTDALGQRVRSRLGGPPRVAVDPHQTFTLCAERGGLLVMEYGGPDWLPVVRDLRSLCGEDIAVVVAVAPARSGAVAGLQHAGADEVVEWDGRPEPVAWAVERLLAARARRVVTPVPVPAAGPAPVTDFGSRPTIFGPESPPILRRGPVAPAVVPAGAWAPASAVPTGEPAPGPAEAVAPAWPTGVPAGPEAEEILAGALASGTRPPGGGAEVAVRVLDALTEAERDALRGEGVTADPRLLRRAAGLRLRVALAMARAPAPGGATDEAAVHALLAEIDGELQALATAGQDDPRPELQVILDTVRSALVTEAIGLTEAVQRIAPAGQPAPAPAAPAARPAHGPPATRLLSMQRGEEARRPVPVGMLVVLLLAAAAAAGYHVNRRLNRPPPPSFHYGGAPHDTVAARAGPDKATVIVKQGGAFDAAEVEQLRAQEEMKGRTVQQLAPGTVVVLPARPPADAAPGATQGGKP